MTRNHGSPDNLSIELAKVFHEWIESRTDRLFGEVIGGPVAYPISKMPEAVLKDLLKFIQPGDVYFHARYGAGIAEKSVGSRVHQVEAAYQSIQSSISGLDSVLNSAAEAFAAVEEDDREDLGDIESPATGHHAAQASIPPSPSDDAEIPDGPLRWQLVSIGGLFSLKERFTENKAESKLIDLLLKRPVRRLPKVTRHHLKRLDALHVDFPNFGPALEVFARSLRLQIQTGSAVKLPAVLLVGPPGIGKTEFSKRLGAALDLELTFRSLAETSGGFILTGHSTQWSRSAAGVIAESVIRCREGRAPMVVLDELDKVRSHTDWAVDQALLGLLEPSSARTFRDEHLDSELDTRPVSYLLTANRIETIRPELLSRLRIIEIQAPTKTEMPAVVISLDRALRAETPALQRLFHALDADVIHYLAAQPPRLIRRTLEDAYANALQDRRVGRRHRVRPSHLGVAPQTKSPARPERRPIPAFYIHRDGWQWIH